VFERFSRSADSAGSGLGLAIARAIVAAHGGTIAAASTPGQGTSITVRLPIDGA
jgi:signal transduction histidine kinase